MSTPVNIERFFPEKLLSRELYQEVKELLKDVTQEEIDAFDDVILKYKDPFSIDPQAAKEVLFELGYDYIADMFEALTEDDIGTILSNMGLIHLLRGSETGLKLIFDLMKFSYDVIHWYQKEKDRKKGPEEDAPLLDTFEWKLSVDVLDSASNDNIFYALPRLQEYSKNYVYSLLAYVELVFRGEIPFQLKGHGAYTDIDLTEETVDIDYTDYQYILKAEDDYWFITDEGFYLKLEI